MMTDTRQLQTARLLNTEAGSNIDDDFADMEAAVRYILGITADTPYSPAFSISAAGNVEALQSLTLAGAPTADLHAATKKYVDDNVLTASAIDRCIGTCSGSINSTAYSDLNISATTETDAGMWLAANPERINITSTGLYIVGCHLPLVHSAPRTEEVGAVIRIYYNTGPVYLASPFLTMWTDEDGGYPPAVSGQIMANLSATSYIKFQGLALSTTDTVSISGGYVWALRIAGVV